MKLPFFNRTSSGKLHLQGGIPIFLNKVIKTNLASCAIHFIDKGISSISFFKHVCIFFSFEKTTADSKGLWQISKLFREGLTSVGLIGYSTLVLPHQKEAIEERRTVFRLPNWHTPRPHYRISVSGSWRREDGGQTFAQTRKPHRQTEWHDGVCNRTDCE